MDILPNFQVFSSGAALATVVGVLVEVPLMLSLVAFANRTKRYFEKHHHQLYTLLRNY